jgi:hypothetical protein
MNWLRDHWDILVAAALWALVVYSGSAQAQTRNVPACVPDKYGTVVPMADGLALKFGRHSAGWWAYWFCEKPDQTVGAEGFWCAHGECKTAEGFAADLRALAPGVADDPVAATKAAFAAAMTVDPVCSSHPAGSLRRQVCEHRLALVKADRAKMTIRVWIVAKAASNANPPGTVPAYPWANGVKGTTSNGRAVEGAACNPSVGALIGSTYWYGVDGRTDQVARCVKEPLP